MLAASCSVQIIQAGTGRLPTGEETSVLQIIRHGDNFEYHNLQSVLPSDVQLQSLVVLLEVPDRCFSVALWWFFSAAVHHKHQHFCYYCMEITIQPSERGTAVHFTLNPGHLQVIGIQYSWWFLSCMQS